jgi:uncharacterized protein (TIGR03663 family)
MYGLDSPPLFYDESVHAYFANTVLKGTYSYDPGYHGPLLFYSVAPIIAFFGETEFTLRILPALLGVAFICSIYLYRRYLGKIVFLAMLFCAVSPIIVNYSRFYREDVYQLLFVSLAAYFLLRYLEAEKKWNEVKFDKLTVFLLLSAVFLALFSAVKETFYVFAFFLLIYLFFYLTRIRISDAVTAILVFFVLYLLKLLETKKFPSSIFFQKHCKKADQIFQPRIFTVNLTHRFKIHGPHPTLPRGIPLMAPL